MSERTPERERGHGEEAGPPPAAPAHRRSPVPWTASSRATVAGA